MQFLKIILLISVVIATIITVLAAVEDLGRNQMGEFYRVDDRGSVTSEWDYAYVGKIFGIYWLASFCLCFFIGVVPVLVLQVCHMVRRSSPWIRIVITVTGVVIAVWFLGSWYIGKAIVEPARNNDVKQIQNMLDNADVCGLKAEKVGKALMEASTHGHLEVVKLLLEKGADVNAKDPDGSTALMKAAGYGGPLVVKLLLDKGADVNVKDGDGSTALMWASRYWDLEVVKKGADVNSEDRFGDTPLRNACMNGRLEVVKLLLEKGADVNAAALREASGHGYLEVVKLLLEKGADVNAKDAKGLTALDLALNKGHGRIVELLKAHGAKE
jgi:hypothetical protein